MSGKIPSYSERLNMIQSGFAITAAIFMIILLLIISGPEALFGSKFTMTSLNSSSVISKLSNTLSVCSENGGKLACESSSKETEAKYEFKQSAFSKSKICQIGSPEAVNVRRDGIFYTESFLLTKCFTIFQNSFLLLLKLVNKENCKSANYCKMFFFFFFFVFFLHVFLNYSLCCEGIYTLPNRTVVKFALLSFLSDRVF